MAARSILRVTERRAANAEADVTSASCRSLYPFLVRCLRRQEDLLAPQRSREETRFVPLPFATLGELLAFGLEVQAYCRKCHTMRRVDRRASSLQTVRRCAFSLPVGAVPATSRSSRLAARATKLCETPP